MSSTDDALEARTRCSVVSIRSVARASRTPRSEEHTSELQSPCNLVCRLLLEKKKTRDAARPRATHARRLHLVLVRGPPPEQGIRALRHHRGQCLCRSLPPGLPSTALARAPVG